MPFEGWFSLINVCFLTLLGYSSIRIVARAARSFSTATLVNAFLSTVIGFGATTFLLFCAEWLLYGTAVHPSVAPGIVLVLLCAAITASYIGLQTISLLRTESPVGSEGTASRKFVPDPSALEDGRIIDLARAGLFDGQLVVPSFLPQELRAQSESGDELSRAKAKKALEALRRLESIPNFTLQFKDTPLVDAGDLSEKLSVTAKRLHATLLTNEAHLGEQGPYLAVDTIASALRPAIPKGEVLSIKIQRLGKEAKQGIGYLEDGTMVVVNGGGDFLGRTIRTQVLSQKYSSTGKIVFCNVREDEDERVPSCSHPETAYGV